LLHFLKLNDEEFPNRKRGREIFITRKKLKCGHITSVYVGCHFFLKSRRNGSCTDVFFSIVTQLSVTCLLDEDRLAQCEFTFNCKKGAEFKSDIHPWSYIYNSILECMSLF